MRPIRTLVPSRVTRLAAAAVLLAAPAALAQVATQLRLTVRAVQWEVQDDNQTHTIHGLAIEGLTGDMNGNEQPRELRALLMPGGWHDQPNHADAKLQFTFQQLQSGADSWQVIDMEFGAALVELVPSQARVAAMAPRMRRAAQEVLQKRLEEVDIPVPMMREAFKQAVLDFVQEKQPGGPERTSLEIIEQAQESELYQTLAGFWPMFITRSITAGAEGTNALLVALPSENAQPNQFVCFARYLSGMNFRMSSTNATMPHLNEGQHLRIDITQTIGNPPQITPGPPGNGQPHHIVTWSHAALCEGWSQVFGVTCPAPPVPQEQDQQP